MIKKTSSSSHQKNEKNKKLNLIFTLIIISHCLCESWTNWIIKQRSKWKWNYIFGETFIYNLIIQNESLFTIYCLMIQKNQKSKMYSKQKKEKKKERKKWKLIQEVKEEENRRLGTCLVLAGR